VYNVFLHLVAYPLKALGLDKDIEGNWPYSHIPYLFILERRYSSVELFNLILLRAMIFKPSFHKLLVARTASVLQRSQQCNITGSGCEVRD
jgi:hypothetical protein